ncbi:MAG TPA: GGDEF domain-containing protein [Candidatus Kaiserbacteria bacterium]|nr:GGDEF domain-containing protein [Candidatus Kaiserbacteria bacterium]
MSEGIPSGKSSTEEKHFSSRRKAAEYAIKEGIAEPVEAGAYRRLDLVGEDIKKLLDDKDMPEQFRGRLQKMLERTMQSEKGARDLHESKIHAENLASIDALTGLPNEAAFMDELDARIKHAERFKTDVLYAIYMDIDKFKPINDTYGHGAGDLYLQLLAKHVRKAFRPDDTFVRLHGDEFAALLFLRHDGDKDSANTNYDDEIDNIIKRVHHAVYVAKCDLRDELQKDSEQAPLIVDEDEKNVSVGYARFEPFEDTKESLLKKADKSMYEAKSKEFE